MLEVTTYSSTQKLLLDYCIYYSTGSDETSLYSRLMNGEQRENILFEAAKNGETLCIHFK